ncbi:hypothetical protein LY76DRAFT_586209 [Colletotrichum caudatum]|nr:hypothetical protein LY76DRAFT_586209 [Colletotrichum caudatum]
MSNYSTSGLLYPIAAFQTRIHNHLQHTSPHPAMQALSLPPGPRRSTPTRPTLVDSLAASQVERYTLSKILCARSLCPVQVCLRSPRRTNTPKLPFPSRPPMHLPSLPLQPIRPDI